MRTDFTDYLFRCHALGKLMTGVKVGLTPKQEETFQDLMKRFQGEGRALTEKQEQTFFDLGAKRSAKPELSSTSKTYLNEIHQHEALGRTNHIAAKYLDKGLQVEHLSASLYSEVTGRPIFKNKEHRQNQFIKGTADNAFKKIRDLKSSWSLSTFPLYEVGITNSDYEWQLQGYMDLWDMDEAELIYCLVDTPAPLIDDEIRRLGWKTDLLTFDGSIREENIPLVVELVGNHIFTRDGLENYCQLSANVHLEWFEDFTEIPADLRVKIFHTQRSPEMLEALYDQIGNARAHLNGLSKSINPEEFAA